MWRDAANLTLWSTYRFNPQGPPGITFPWVGYQNYTVRLFTAALGQVGQGFERATAYEETNVREAGRISAMRPVYLRRVDWSIRGGSAHDRLLLSNSIWALDLTQLRFDGSPLDHFDIDCGDEAERAERIELLRARNPDVIYGSAPFPLPESNFQNAMFAIQVSLGPAFPGGAGNPDRWPSRPVDLRITLSGVCPAA